MSRVEVDLATAPHPAPAARPASAAAPGTIRLSGRQARFQRAMILLMAVGPLVGLVLAIVSLWGWGISVLDLVLLLSTYVVTGLGVTIGFHRLLTHRSFDGPARMKVAFAVLGSLAVEGSVINWVADHRRHHAFADKEGDPHSPHWDQDDGLAGMLKGLWHAHLGWFFSDVKTDNQRWAPDLQKDPALRRVDRLSPILATASFFAPGIAGGLLTWSWAGALTGFLWGGAVRVLLLHHVTFSVNSICHYFGTRPYETTDLSTNNWPLAVLSFGESWHNNHHAFPTSAVHGLGRYQVDLSAGVISALERMGVAQNVKRPTEKQLANKG